MTGNKNKNKGIPPLSTSVVAVGMTKLQLGKNIWNVKLCSMGAPMQQWTKMVTRCLWGSNKFAYTRVKYCELVVKPITFPRV